MASEKAYYTILLSGMALFAAIAAYAKEPASVERAAVLTTVGHPDAHRKALEAYDRALTAKLTRLYAPKKARPPVVKTTVAKPMPIAKATPIRTVETHLPGDAKTALPAVQTPEDAVTTTLNAEIRGLYAACLKSGPRECCTPLIDHRAAMPLACGNRSPASTSVAARSQEASSSTENTASASTIPADGAETNPTVNASSTAM